ncbi:MAG: DUF6600 domain-containing protein [Bryobacteraceae bacterium]
MNRKLLVVLTFGVAAAYQSPAQDADSSGRGVARLSLLSGDVSVRRGDTGEWVAAAVNAPLLGEDQVLTGGGSRAEVQFDYAHYARLSGNTELRLADIENRKYLVRLARGTMNFRVLRSNDANAEISTPSIAIRPLKKGIYRVSVLDDGSTEVTVRSGEAEIFTPRGSQKLKSGRMLMARGSFSDPEFQFANAGMIDDWDRWNESRDRQLENSRSYDYVSQDIYGAEDLDGHGRWVDTPEYGNVWAPSASADWAPYRNGRWSWVDYYGWNWISYDPWGWAPYHYGRWINRPSIGWCWWPGRIASRHYWSPGQVAFFGWGGGYGGGLSIGIGFGNWGWVPLAPFETYYPWYGRGYYGGYRNRTYNNVTIVNNTNITNIYRNARHDNGITSVNAGQFGRGSVNNVRFNRNDIERASVVRGQLPLVPDASSTRMSDRESRISDNRGASRGDDRFYSTRQATKLDRVPFENQRSAMQEVSRRTFGDAGSDSSRRGGEVAGGGRGSVDRGVGARGTDSGFSRRAGETVNTDRSADRTGGRGGSVDSGASARGIDSGLSRRAGETANTDRSADRTGGRGGSVDTTGGGTANSDRGGWRRFGDSSSPASSAAPSSTSPDRSVDRGGGRGASVDGGASIGGGDRGSWRRFGDSTSDRSTGRGASADTGRGTSTDSWRRMSETPSTGRTTVDSGSSVDRGAFDRGNSGSERRSIDRGNIDRGERGGSSSFDRGAFDRGNSGSERRSIDRGSIDRGGRGSSSSDSSPRMSAPPPVVRERSAPDFGGRGGGSFGSSRGESRQQSAPRMERSAPSAPSGNPGGGRGGDGGGSRSEGRGGGRVR